MTLQPHTPVSRQCHEKHSSYDGSNLQSTGGRALTLFCSMTPGGVSQRRFIGGGGEKSALSMRSAPLPTHALMVFVTMKKLCCCSPDVHAFLPLLSGYIPIHG